MAEIREWLNTGLALLAIFLSLGFGLFACRQGGAANSTADEALSAAHAANDVAEKSNALAGAANDLANASNARADEANELALDANEIAQQSNTTADDANDLAERANDIAGRANDLVTTQAADQARIDWLRGKLEICNQVSDGTTAEATELLLLEAINAMDAGRLGSRIDELQVELSELGCEAEAAEDPFEDQRLSRQDFEDACDGEITVVATPRAQDGIRCDGNGIWVSNVCQQAGLGPTSHPEPTSTDPFAWICTA